MELVKEYTETYQKRMPTIENHGECEELHQGAGTLIKLRIRAHEGTIEIKMNGIMLQEGIDFSEWHKKEGSYVALKEEPYIGNVIQIRYQGYEIEGD